ncbi:CMD domain-containing protein, partial [Escherichia coli]
STHIINLLVWRGLCAWINRLKISLGESYYPCRVRQILVKLSAALMATKIENYVSGQPADSAS